MKNEKKNNLSYQILSYVCQNFAISFSNIFFGQTT